MSQISNNRKALEADIRSAFVFAYPLYAFAETRFRAVQDPDNPQRHAPNTICHNRHLSDHRSLWITAPNNDTLYSNAWLDLSSGPVRIRAGAMPEGRYWSLAFMDAFTNHFAVIGQRLEGTGPVDVTVVGPEHSTLDIPGRVIRAPGKDAWMFCRCLVDGPADLPQAHAMQDQIEISPQTRPARQYVPPPKRPVSPENFLDVVNALLLRNPVSLTEQKLLENWAAVGLCPGTHGAWHEISADVRAIWSLTIADNYHALSQAGQAGRRNVNGWIVAASDIGNFAQNYPLRASVALGGLGALEPIEAMYFVKYQDEKLQSLDGRQRYLLQVPASGIPTNSFWSFTMYGYTADGKRILVENPISRFSIGNRTPGLAYNADGSLDIVLQHDAPTDRDRQANWLPTPQGAFHISLRAYLPHRDLRDGSAPLPVVVPTEK